MNTGCPTLSSPAGEDDNKFSWLELGSTVTCRHIYRAFSYGKCNIQHLNLSFQFDFRLCQVWDRTTKRVTECYPCCFEMEI